MVSIEKGKPVELECEKASTVGDGNNSDNIDYDDALRTTHREAAATLVVAVLVALFFWGAVWLLHDVPGTSAGFPLWFWWAIPGGYLASIVGVVFLLRRVFRNFSLDLRPDAQSVPSGTRSTPDARS